ncbi:MAG: type II toxin-antitoxin system Phd/YefM family antitoxin [Myxococcota bacterium]
MVSRRKTPRKVTASQLRADIYRILDGVLETGTPVEIERNGRTLRIVADAAPSKLERLIPRPEFIRGDPEDLVHLDWSAEWRP